MPPEKLHWKHLYSEVVTSGLCTGCSGCVIACPHDVLGYRDDQGIYRPFQLEEGFAPDNCSHGERGCTSCTRACPRFRAWEPDIDEFLFGHVRAADEPSGIYKDIVLARATDPILSEIGQDGGLVSAILVYALEHDLIDAALVSYLEGDGSTWKAVPGVARTREDVMASAGSRYTYSANPMAYSAAIEGGAERIALVGMSCQSSMPPVMKQRKAGKVARRFELNIGLLCSKTFDDAIFDELFDAKYGLKKADIKKVNVKGVFQLWMHNGDYHEVPLKECHPFTREGCKMCPDFAAEHADISTGGIGKFNDWTLTIVRTDTGRDLMAKLVDEGWVETRPGDDDPEAIALMRRLSVRSRKRWPETAFVDAPRLIRRHELTVRVVALVDDLMDRSRLTAAVPDASFTRDASTCTGAEVVVIDLTRHAADVAGARAAAPAARIVAFGPHVDDDLLARAAADGADVVVARSVFFRNPAEAVNGA